MDLHSADVDVYLFQHSDLLAGFILGFCIRRGKSGLLKILRESKKLACVHSAFLVCRAEPYRVRTVLDCPCECSIIDVFLCTYTNLA